MKHQITVRLDPGIARALQGASRRLGLRRSDIVRAALRQFLGAGTETAGKAPHERVRDLIGTLESQIPDLAERHREYILDSLRRGG